MIKNVVRAISCVLIFVCAVTGFITVRFYSNDDSDVGTSVVRLLYEYDSIPEVDQRMLTLQALCTDEVYAQLNVLNEEHYADAYRRVGTYPTIVRIVFTRPGLVVYALDNAVAYPTDLWMFEYDVTNGLVSAVREYHLAGWREDKNGGLF